jgi:carbonic anhydrase/acetyltransferase-like protein (isoleucine patch superfamily)
MRNNLGSWLRKMRLSARGAEFLGRAFVERHVDVDLGERWGKRGRIVIGDAAHLSIGVVLHCFGFGGTIAIDENVFLGPYSVIYGQGGVHIGRDTLVAMHARIIAANHKIPDRNHRMRYEPDELLPIEIGSDVWIGGGVTVTGGVTIGDGCVVGAGAVVTSDLPAYSIAAGVPARVIGSRE